MKKAMLFLVCAVCGIMWLLMLKPDEPYLSPPVNPAKPDHPTFHSIEDAKPVMPFTMKKAADSEAANTAVSMQAEAVKLLHSLLSSSSAPQAPAVPQVPETPAKTVYLTFDDGPSGLTGEVLDILKENNVPATFFILGKQAEQRPELVSRIAEEGHAIGNHTYDHDYSQLYRKFTLFWDQIKQTEEIIRSITGERPQLLRAPGGTAGKFDETYFKLLKQAGYRVFDWNADSGDSKRIGVPADEIVRQSTMQTAGDEINLLLHDGAGHEETVKALPRIIEHYKEAGYRFAVLTPETAPVQFKVQSKVKPKESQPGSRWVAEHIVPNGQLFDQGKVLTLDMAGLAAEFQPGEYRIENGRLMVPLRSAVERLGGRVSWDAPSRTARVSLSGASWSADPGLGMLWSPHTSMKQPSEVMIWGNAVWIPLRDILHFSGHPLNHVVMKEHAYQIETL
ncbi:polysaccharide deacetylase [Paenibacillus algicola]|uniref:Polysaccharide deacetylase n=1 Tax=Paenibacillus algicola TaxID=2565926 RepID=A0A4P8XGE4_9BACL|nr:polysaccharide deacetylase [Paenibacillus algicola]QCT01375.1 polysaccharide deacetylase [Paenibacillus algicola]